MIYSLDDLKRAVEEAYKDGLGTGFYAHPGCCSPSDDPCYCEPYLSNVAKDELWASSGAYAKLEEQNNG